MIDWQIFGEQIEVAGKLVEVRSLRLPDNLDNYRRYRVTTTWNRENPKFTSVPARGRLARDPQGRIGAVVMGATGGFLKVGRFTYSPVFIFVPLSSLSQKPRRRILGREPLEFFSEGEALFAREQE